MLDSVRSFMSYLLGKRSELEDMDLKDLAMAKAILDIHRTRTRKEIVAVPLFSLSQIHLLDRENAMLATEQRVKTLQTHKEEILSARTISCEVLARYLPSVSWIKVVEEQPGAYLAFEGNGRLAAMQQVFSPDDEMLVEVERYYFRNPRKIVRRMNRVRRMNGLIGSR